MNPPGGVEAWVFYTYFSLLSFACFQLIDVWLALGIVLQLMVFECSVVTAFWWHSWLLRGVVWVVHRRFQVSMCLWLWCCFCWRHLLRRIWRVSIAALKLPTQNKITSFSAHKGNIQNCPTLEISLYFFKPNKFPKIWLLVWLQLSTFQWAIASR